MFSDQTFRFNYELKNVDKTCTKTCKASLHTCAICKVIIQLTRLTVHYGISGYLMVHSKSR